MSSDPAAIKGTIILHAKLEAKSTEAADEIIELLLANKKYLKENNPGVLTYRINKFDKDIMVFEEYADLKAMALNQASPVFKKFEAKITGPDSLVVKPLSIGCYSEAK